MTCNSAAKTGKLDPCFTELFFFKDFIFHLAAAPCGLPVPAD